MAAMAPLIEQHLEDIRVLAPQYGVARLEVFGSVATSDFDPARSDIDFLVAYPPGYDFGPWLKRLHELRQALEVLLGHRVDVVDMWALRNKWFSREAAKTRQVIYDASDVAQIA
jgi:predicted nucleotidyltransferase